MINNTGGIGNVTSDESFANDKIARLLLYSLIFVIGLVGNTLVLIVIKGKQQCTVNDYFVLNLTISDLFFIASLPTDIYLEVSSFTYTQFYCKLLYPLTTFGLFLSVNTMTSMAIERCYVIARNTSNRMSKQMVFCWLGAIWVASFICVLPLTIVAEATGDYCNEKWPSKSHQKAYTAALCVLQYILPLTIIAVSYIRIVHFLINSRAPTRARVTDEGRLAIETSRRKENIKIIKTTAVIVLLFMALMFLHQLAWMMWEFGKESQVKSAIEIMKYSPIPLYFNSCVNPFVYGTFSKQYRQLYLRYLRCTCCRSNVIAPSATGIEDETQETHRNVRQRPQVIIP